MGQCTDGMFLLCLSLFLGRLGLVNGHRQTIVEHSTTMDTTYALQGGKNRRRGKNENDDEKRELVFKEDGQGGSRPHFDVIIQDFPDMVVSRHTEYAQVIKMLGNGRLEAMCFDGEKRLAHIRGKMRKKVWINQGDIILLSLREFQDDKADVIQKYTADEARNLKAYGELPETAKINETDTFGPGEEDDNIEFDEDDIVGRDNLYRMLNRLSHRLCDSTGRHRKTTSARPSHSALTDSLLQ